MIRFEIRGLDGLIKRCSPQILEKPLRNFFERVTITAESKAKPLAPVDTGHLRASIQREVDRSELPTWGAVGILDAREGSPLWFKARAMEYGTGRVGDPAVSHKASHFPPWGAQNPALETWARRHGFASGFRVAQAIGRRGGLRPRPFLRPALAESVGSIQTFLMQLGNEIKAAF